MDPRTAFHPLFAHQSFGNDEVICGFKDLRIVVTLSDPCMHAHVDVSHGGQWDGGGASGTEAAAAGAGAASVTGVDDVEALLAKGLPAGWTKDRAVFADVVRSARLPDAVRGGATVLHYTRSGSGSDGTPAASDAAAEPAQRTFVVKNWKLQDADSAVYHRRLETLAWWLIDGETIASDSCLCRGGMRVDTL